MARPLSKLQKLAWLFAALFLFVYSLDYVPGIMYDNGKMFGLFSMTPIVDVGHLALGALAAISAMISAKAARVYFWALGIWYGLLLIVVGLTTGVVRAAAAPPAGAPRLLYVSVADMAMFGGFFAAAIWFRKKPKVHRPAMVVAATALLVAAVGRMTFLPPNDPIRLAIWSLPILIAMASEFKKTSRVHPIYFLGLGVFVIRRYSVPVIIATDAWGSFARWVFGLVA